MPYTVTHTYVDQELNPSVTISQGWATVECSASGSMPIRFPGQLVVSADTTYMWMKTTVIHRR